MDLLGPSIKHLFKSFSKKFSLKTVLMLADQMISCVECIHSKGIIHRNIKPGNFVMGRGKHARKVYIIDFGVSKSYRDERTGEHVAFREGVDFRPNEFYASPNAIRQRELSRRDDLVSLGFTLVYLIRGWLPWRSSRNVSVDEYACAKENMSKICKVNLI